MVKLDLGSGPRERWVSSDPEWLHFDCEDYEGVIKWNCPGKLPFDANVVDEIYIGQLLVETSIADHLSLADEIARIMKSEGLVRILDFDGVLGFPEFFRRMETYGWLRVKEELNHILLDGTKQYLVELKWYSW